MNLIQTAIQRPIAVVAAVLMVLMFGWVSLQTIPIQLTPDVNRPIITIDPLRRGAGLTLERIIPYTNGHLLQCNIHHIAAGGSSDGTIAHDGEEVGYVLSGRIELEVDGRQYALSAGDAFVFRSTLPHGYRNPGEEPASIFWVNTPPTF